MPGFDVAVVGGGMIGAALGYGLVRCGCKVVMLDEGDVAWRAARGNFGLVWVQGKGLDAPAYAEWTQRGADLWPGFAAGLYDLTEIDIGYSRPGGIEFCLTEAEWQERELEMRRLHNQSGGGFRYEMLDRQALAELVPDLGPEVLGGSYSPLDGHANPLYLLRALHEAFVKLGGDYRPQRPVTAILVEATGFTLRAGDQAVSADRVVLAAGLGNRDLAPQVGVKAPVAPLRGQIMVTEKARPFLDLPTALLRQTVEGGCLLGDSHEEVGFDHGTTLAVMGSIAQRAVTTFPFLASLRVVRSWGALRIMTADGLPIYEQSQDCPGAFLASTHSGVTLAAAHASLLAEGIAKGKLPDGAAAFGSERFDV